MYLYFYDYSNTYSKAAALDGFCKSPKYSPIICLLKPLREIKNLATA